MNQLNEQIKRINTDYDVLFKLFHFRLKVLSIKELFPQRYFHILFNMKILYKSNYPLIINHENTTTTLYPKIINFFKINPLILNIYYFLGRSFILYPSLFFSI